MAGGGVGEMGHVSLSLHINQQRVYSFHRNEQVLKTLNLGSNAQEKLLFTCRLLRKEIEREKGYE